MAEKKDVKRYKCSNFGVCQKADSGETIEIPTIETLGGTPDCPHCHQHTLEEVIDKGPNWKLIGGIAAAVVVLGGGGAFLALGGDDKAEPVEPEPIEVVEETIEQDAEMPEAVEVEVAEIPEEPKDDGKEVKGGGKTKPQEPKVPAGRGRGTVNLGYGTYSGDLYDGQPDGAGLLTFSRSHQLTSEVTAEPGDQLDGVFTSGRFNTGTLTRKATGETIKVKR